MKVLEALTSSPFLIPTAIPSDCSVVGVRKKLTLAPAAAQILAAAL